MRTEWLSGDLSRWHGFCTCHAGSSHSKNRKRPFGAEWTAGAKCAVSGSSPVTRHIGYGLLPILMNARRLGVDGWSSGGNFAAQYPG